MDPSKAVLYVGESSRSIQERSKEHWANVRGRKEDSHMIRHQMIEHGAEYPPKFIMRVVSYPRTALSRQFSEAVRIRVENKEEVKEREQEQREEDEQLAMLIDREHRDLGAEQN